MVCKCICVLMSICVCLCLPTKTHCIPMSSVLASVTSCVESIPFGLGITPSSTYIWCYLQLSMVGEVDIGVVLACYWCRCWMYSGHIGVSYWLSLYLPNQIGYKNFRSHDYFKFCFPTWVGCLYVAGSYLELSIHRLKTQVGNCLLMLRTFVKRKQFIVNDRVSELYLVC